MCKVLGAHPAQLVALLMRELVAIGLLMLAIAFDLTEAQTWRAATVNPATILRGE